MVFRVNQWGWQAKAVRLLLAPLMAGAMAAPVFAQQYPTSGANRPTDTTTNAGRMAPASRPSTTDPKELLKLGRSALAEGNFDVASDYAFRANASFTGGRWGVFGDTPDSLIKDIRTAKAKANQTKADRYFAEAKTYFERPARTEQERLANLEQAAAFIDQAVALSGESRLIDDINPFSEKPTELKREIDSERAKLRRNIPVPPSPRNPSALANAAQTGKPKYEQELRQVSAQQPGTFGGDIPPLPGLDPVEAPKPMTKPVAPEAPSAPPMPVMPSLPDVPGVPATAEPTPPASVPDVPSLPTPKPAPATEAPKADVDMGRKLLNQSKAELRAGELDLARSLAVKAHNGEYGVKDEAQQILAEIDAEVLAIKKREVAEAYKAVSEAINTQQYQHALGILERMDSRLLTPQEQAKIAAMSQKAQEEMIKLAQPAPQPTTTLVQTPPSQPENLPSTLIPSQPTPGTPSAPGQTGSLTDQMKAMAEVEFQQLRSEGLQVESSSRKSFEKGETDVAIQSLADFINKVRSSKLSESRQALLVGPVERRLETFRMMKHQRDHYAAQAAEKQENREKSLTKTSAEIAKNEEIAKRVRQINELLARKSYDSYLEAEQLAMQVKHLDPDNPTLTLVYELSKRNRRAEEMKQAKNSREEMFWEGMLDAEKPGPFVNLDNPLIRNRTLDGMARFRGNGSDFYLRSMSSTEREIELKLEKPLTVDFQQATMREVIEKFAVSHQLNIVLDDAALEAESISVDTFKVTENIRQPISLRNVLQLILSKAKLQAVVENDVIRVTTEKKAKGRLYTKVYSVMDLVTPIPDFALPEHASLSKALERAANQTKPWQDKYPGAGNTPYLPNNGLGGASMTGSASNQPGMDTPGFSPSGSGVLNNQQNPMSAGATLAPTRVNASEQLKKLVTGMVKPYSWEDLGGNGKIAYYDIGGALVVNQTADVLKEVQDLLESLRRLQDISVAVEIRVVSLTEAFYERVGIDFAMNIKTKGTENFEQQLTTGSFRPAPFINDINTTGTTVGWNPAAGGFTSDLDIPIRPNTYGFSVPPFGGYPGNGNGGLNVGLAFLNDIQVFMFLEAAAGDRRVNIMQAPKVTLFNGQTSTVSVNDFAFFTTNLQVFNVGGQFLYIPQNQPFPIGGNNGGISLTVQAVVTADRRFVRMNLAPQLSTLTSATVPLFPITAFITPVFEGGSQGVPIPFTQFFQQPSFTDITVQTTVLVPDGGTVLLGGLKTMSEGRTEAGPPVLSNVPYLNRLFRNTGIGRETRHIMIMVTPRIIITADEEQLQTGER